MTKKSFSFLRYFLAALLLTLLFIYAGRVSFLWQNQSKYIYHPTREWTITPASKGLQFEDIYFSARDGVKLSGWLVSAKVSSKSSVALICHGNAGNISDKVEDVFFFHKLGLDVFIFDYRGFGKSEGEISEEGTYLDAEAAYDYLIQTKKYDPSQIIIVGRSLGAAVASHLALQHSPRALILESGFTSLSAMARERYPYFPVGWLLKYRYETLQHVKKLGCPIFIVHSRDDEVVPFSHGLKLYGAANDPKEFLEIKGPHTAGYLESEKLYAQKLKAFLDSAPL